MERIQFSIKIKALIEQANGAASPEPVTPGLGQKWSKVGRAIRAILKRIPKRIFLSDWYSDKQECLALLTIYAYLYYTILQQSFPVIATP